MKLRISLVATLALFAVLVLGVRVDLVVVAINSENAVAYWSGSPSQEQDLRSPLPPPSTRRPGRRRAAPCSQGWCTVRCTTPSRPRRRAVPVRRRRSLRAGRLGRGGGGEGRA